MLLKVTINSKACTGRVSAPKTKIYMALKNKETTTAITLIESRGILPLTMNRSILLS